MKILPFLFISLFLTLLIFFASDFNIAYAQSQSGSVKVATMIDEYLSFGRSGDGLFLATNFHAGLVLFNDKETICIDEPAELKIATRRGPLMVVVNY